VGSKSDLISRLYAHVAETVKVPSAASATQMQDLSRAPANPVVEPEQPATADVPVLSTESDPSVGVCATLQNVLEADCAKSLEANPVSSAKMPVALEENVRKELQDEGLLEAAPVMANVQHAEIPATDKPVAETAKETTQLSVDVAVVAEHDVLASTEESEKDAVMQMSKHASTTQEQADAQDQVSMHQEGPFNGAEEGNTVVDAHMQAAPQADDFRGAPADLVVELPATADVSVLSTESDPSVGAQEENAIPQRSLGADCAENLEANPVLPVEMPVILEENVHKELPDEGVLEAAFVMGNVRSAEIAATDKPVMEAAGETTQLSVDVAVGAEHPVLANMGDSERDAVIQVSERANTSQEQADAQEQVSMHLEGPFNGVEEGNTAVDVQMQPVPQSEDFSGAPADPVVEPEQPATADVSVLNTESETSVGAHEENASPQRALESDCAENLEANPVLSVQMPVILEENMHTELPDEGVLEAAFVMGDVRDAKSPVTNKPVVEAAGETTQLSVDVAVEA